MRVKQAKASNIIRFKLRKGNHSHVKIFCRKDRLLLLDGHFAKRIALCGIN